MRVRIAIRVAVAVVAVLLGAVVAAADPEPDAAARTDSETPRGVLRVGVAARIGEDGTLSPLRYWGGFQTKTACFEPLVRAASDGSLVPALAASWEASDGGRAWTLTLREDVLCHDGTKLTARAVAEQLERVRADPAHRWLGSVRRLTRAEAPDDRRVRVTLSEPWYLPPELAAVNPFHVVAPASWNGRGDAVASLGTGPFRVVRQVPEKRISLAAHDAWWGGRPGLGELELLPLPTRDRESEEVLRVLLRGEVDLVSDIEGPTIVREQLEEIRDDPRWRVWSWPGTSVTYLAFNTTRGPFADVEMRRLAASELDRKAIVERSELGHADAWTSLFRAPGAGWPSRGRSADPGISAPDPPVEARLLFPAAVTPRVYRMAAAVAQRLRRAGVVVRLVLPSGIDEHERRLRAGDWDLRFDATQGNPYDPWMSVQSLFLKDPEAALRTASPGPPLWRDDALAAALREALASADPEVHRKAFAAAQARLDDQVPVVPLFASHRLAVTVAGVEGLAPPSTYDLGLGSVRISR